MKQGRAAILVARLATGLVASTAIMLGWVAPAWTAAPNANPRHIIGKNDLQPVCSVGSYLPAGLSELIGGFGYVSVGCTATHLGNGIVITAGHCFIADAYAKPQTDQPCEDAYTGDAVTIEWRLLQAGNPASVSKCTRILALEVSEERDYAILRVDNPPPVSVRADLSGRPPLGSRLTIFSHPLDRPLEWSGYCRSMPRGLDSLDQLTEAPPSMFGYNCDTQHGSSGAAVLSAVTRQIVGIHDGGTVLHNYGTYLVDTPIATYLTF